MAQNLEESVKIVKNALEAGGVYPDAVSKNKDGHIVVRDTFFYKAGRTSEGHTHKVKKALDAAGIKHSIVDDGEHWAPFRGGASVAKSSHFYTHVKLHEDTLEEGSNVPSHLYHKPTYVADPSAMAGDHHTTPEQRRAAKAKRLQAKAPVSEAVINEVSKDLLKRYVAKGDRSYDNLLDKTLDSWKSAEDNQDRPDWRRNHQDMAQKFSRKADRRALSLNKADARLNEENDLRTQIFKPSFAGNAISDHNKHLAAIHKKLGRGEIEQVDSLHHTFDNPYGKTTVLTTPHGTHITHVIHTREETMNEAYPSAAAMSRKAKAVKQARAVANGYANQKSGKWSSQSYKTEDGRWGSKDVKEETGLTEDSVAYKHYSFTAGPKTSNHEIGAPEHIVAHPGKMGTLGVHMNKGDGYGETSHVTVTNMVSGEKSHHNVYQREWGHDEDRPTVSIRHLKDIHPGHTNALKHFLAGKTKLTEETLVERYKRATGRAGLNEASEKTLVSTKGSDKASRYEMHTNMPGEASEYSSIIKTHQDGKPLQNRWGGYNTLRTGKTAYVKKHFDRLDEEILAEQRGFKAPELESAGYKFKYHSAAGPNSPASTLYHHPELDKHIEITHERTGMSGAKKRFYFYSGKYGSNSGGMQSMHHNLNDAIRKNDGSLKEEVITELSKGTLGSYIKKASNDVASKAVEYGTKKAERDEVDRITNRHMKYADKDTVHQALKTTSDDVEAPRVKAAKRIGGIAKAVGKLTNEETTYSHIAIRSKTGHDEFNKHVSNVSAALRQHMAAHGNAPSAEGGQGNDNTATFTNMTDDHKAAAKKFIDQHNSHHAYSIELKENVQLDEAPYYSLEASKARMAKEKARATAKAAIAAAKVDSAIARKEARENRSLHIARHIEAEVGNHYPDSDGFEAISNKVRKMGIPHHEVIDHLDKAARKHLGAKSFDHYVDNFHKDAQGSN
jgi:hypothetical protein